MRPNKISLTTLASLLPNFVVRWCILVKFAVAQRFAEVPLKADDTGEVAKGLLLPAAVKSREFASVLWQTSVARACGCRFQLMDRCSDWNAVGPARVGLEPPVARVKFARRRAIDQARLSPIAPVLTEHHAAVAAIHHHIDVVGTGHRQSMRKIHIGASAAPPEVVLAHAAHFAMHDMISADQAFQHLLQNVATTG
jgi:hypothetical protein